MSTFVSLISCSVCKIALLGCLLSIFCVRGKQSWIALMLAIVFLRPASNMLQYNIIIKSLTYGAIRRIATCIIRILTLEIVFSYSFSWYAWLKS